MLSRLQRKFGRFAIPNLTVYMIAVYLAGYVLSYMGRGILAFLAFEPSLVLKGQVWRLFTWILVPPTRSNLLVIFLMLFIFYQFGTILERTWGDFQYNFYIFNGMLLTLACGFIGYGITRAMGMQVFDMSYTTYYVSTSIILAVAAMYPDMEVRLYFLIPIKFRWAALIDVLYMVYSCAIAFRDGDMAMIAMIIACFANLLIMLALLKQDKGQSASPLSAARAARRRSEYHKKIQQGNKDGYVNKDGIVTKHRCTVCGRTELDGDDLEFRYCSKCKGSHEYCQDHLFNHKHIT